MIRAFVARVLARLPCRVIAHDGDPYLMRWYVCGPLPSWFAEHGAQPRCTWLPTVYLHRFLRADADHALHNHPWRFAIAFVLRSGYVEERLAADGSITRRVVRWFNIIGARTFHRVAYLLGDDAWTLIVLGKRTGSWGFRLSDGTFIPWQEFEATREPGALRARLQTLSERWHAAAYQYWWGTEKSKGDYDDGKGDGTSDCADELDALLKEIRD